MHDAIKNHDRFHVLADSLQGSPEARMLEAIVQKFYSISSPNISIIIEDQSKNCGSNASNTKEELEKCGIQNPKSLVAAQDPTMCRRTIASFRKVYENEEHKPEFWSWPTFVPLVRIINSESDKQLDLSRLDFDIPGLDEAQLAGLWNMERFLSLIVGEIPRLRDDLEGYGPLGKGFIAHVDIPQDIEEAWGVLSQLIQPRNADTKA